MNENRDLFREQKYHLRNSELLEAAREVEIFMAARLNCFEGQAKSVYESLHRAITNAEREVKYENNNSI